MDAVNNLAISFVATAPSPATSGTVFSVLTGGGASFPAVPFDAVVGPAGVALTRSNAEIIRVTAVSGDTLTALRGQYGTTPIAIQEFYQVYQGITANLLEQIANNSLATRNSAGKNLVINCGMDVWQRGTSFASGGYPYYTADRWNTDSAGQATFSRVASGIQGFTYALRSERNSGSSVTSPIYVEYNLESADSIPFQGQQMTVSFYARAGANFSGTSNEIGFILNSGTGTDQRVIAGFTGSTSLVNLPVVLTTSWQRYSFTFTVPTNSTQLGFYLGYSPFGTAGAADYFDITGVQLEMGASATPFSRAGGNIAEETKLCQRYYWQNGGVSYTAFGLGYGTTTSIANILITFPQTMRAIPSMSYGGSLELSGSSGINVTSLALAGNATTTVNSVVQASAAASLTVGAAYELNALNFATAYVAYSAEL